jgi:ABC-type phosphate transport system substrate-binding protein
MAISNIKEEKKKIEEKKEELQKLKIHSEAIAKLYKNKNPIDNSKNNKR